MAAPTSRIQGGWSSSQRSSVSRSTYQQQATYTNQTRTQPQYQHAAPSQQQLSAPLPSQRASGTREWASQTVNCVTGCEHDCLYCYAKHDSCYRFNRVAPEAWHVPQVRWEDVHRKRHKVDGTVMFPSTHDITPSVLEPCIILLRNLLVM